MPTSPEDKQVLSMARCDLIAKLSIAVTTEERVQFQAELTAVNARLKALNTQEAARHKAQADIRRAAGRRENAANAMRVKNPAATPCPGCGEDARYGCVDQALHTQIDNWVGKLLMEHDCALYNAPGKWRAVVSALCLGLHVVARHEDVASIETRPPPAPAPAPKAKTLGKQTPSTKKP